MNTSHPIDSSPLSQACNSWAEAGQASIEAKQSVFISSIQTPLGIMLAGTSQRGICLLEFNEPVRLETQIKRLNKWLKTEFIAQQHPHLTQIEQELTDYFAGRLQQFTVPLHMTGTDFQQKAWQALQSIAYASTRSYQQQASIIDNAKAVRAVARANADNRIAIVIPCHRVIGKNGQLTGYGGGIWRKQNLLELESTYAGKNSN